MKATHKLELVKPEAVLDSEHIRLLLVDDNAQDTEVLRKILLSHDDIEFFHCADPSQALNIAIGVNPTVILQSLFVSDTNGLDMVKEFHEQKELADVSIVVVYSKDDEPDIKEEIFSAGADDCLIKSSGELEILARIRYHSRASAEHHALQDVATSLEETRGHIFQSEKMASIGQLAAGVAHEINNPVAFVTSNINSMSNYYNDVFSVITAYEKLENTLSSDSPGVKAVKELKERLQISYIKDDIEQIMNECKDGLTRIRKIVDDLKNFSREEEIEWKWTDLHKEIDSTLNIANHEIKYKADVNKNYAEIPEVECVPSQLNQVFLNLLVNAAHAIDERGTITITTLTGALPENIADNIIGTVANTAVDSWVCVKVADTGNGIDTDIIQHIFDPFFTTKPFGKGTGLGLPLSHNIVQKHGGCIDVDSEPGKGTTFSVWLPVRQVTADEM